MTTIDCPACRAHIRDRGRRWLESLALAFVTGVAIGLMFGRLT